MLAVASAKEGEARVSGIRLNNAIYRLQPSYLSPWLKTNGCEPSIGHIDLSLKELVSQITSNISCGSLTGCVAGQGPLLSNVPVSGYETWLE
jgi:hypothetical protein